jgi:hypothetical protein
MGEISPRFHHSHSRYEDGIEVRHLHQPSYADPKGKLITPFIIRQLQTLIAQAKLSDIKRKIIAHKSDMINARQHYQLRRSRAKFDSSTYASLIIDGMDQVSIASVGVTVIQLTRFLLQAKTHVPYNSTDRISQQDVQQNRLVQRIHGVIIHGIGTFLFILEPLLVNKGSNQGKLH